MRFLDVEKIEKKEMDWNGHKRICQRKNFCRDITKDRKTKKIGFPHDVD